ncbi:MAG TPA: penicillin-binding protein, partial [Thermus scotoductus]|nr:penicillin-binding protein [Thermus scotoductus]
GALRGRPGGDFPPPAGLVQVGMDLLSGQPSQEGVKVWFPQGKVPVLPLQASPSEGTGLLQEAPPAGVGPTDYPPGSNEEASPTPPPGQ